MAHGHARPTRDTLDAYGHIVTKVGRGSGRARRPPPAARRPNVLALRAARNVELRKAA